MTNNSAKLNSGIKFVWIMLIPLFSQFSTCHCQGKVGDSILKKIAITFKTNLVLVNEDSTFTNHEMNDSLCVYYQDGYCIYQLPYTFITMTEDGRNKEETRYRYLAHKKNNPYCYEFKTIDAVVSKRKLIDSVQMSFLQSIRNFKFFDAKNDSMVVAKKMPDGTIIEKYIPKIKFDESYPDTSFFTFTTELKNTNYSFSTLLEEKRKLKISKVRFLYNCSSHEKLKVEGPERNLVFEIKEIPADNPSQIQEIFKHLKNAEKKPTSAQKDINSTNYE
jgi:hypothetical protein